ncbi:ImmA/IrrE family metallo-endopeptidase [Neobacillus sp. 114]|uniref:ImmA/IrrE family metallo-endopeptidase n=1 Tax=Neobacillus sp. 114 TaxID=3048535 RepID=UPI0024C41B35|nr:ImmA/IrrE family metallo-endopeptidase [Neobacillus sp. 114]
MTRVNVKPKLINWAYLRSQKAEEIKQRFNKLDGWLSGEINPTLKQLEEFAKATATPLGYFFLDEPPVEVLPVPHYRTLADDAPVQASPDLIETIHIMQRRQDFIKDYFDDHVGEELPFVGIYKGNSPTELANRMREFLGLKKDWAAKIGSLQDALKYLIEKCEEKQITVMINGIVGNNTKRKLNVEEFRGFVLVDKLAPLIFINGADAKSAQIFTLIHELAHIFNGSSAIVEASPLNTMENDLEILCNSSAAEFLCPEDLFKQYWLRSQSNDLIYESLAYSFKVSQLVIGRRALELGFISKEQFFKFYESYSEELKSIKETKSGGTFYPTARVRLGNLFSRIVIYQTRAGNIQYTDAYRLTGMRGNTFHKYVNFFEGKGV